MTARAESLVAAARSRVAVFALGSRQLSAVECRHWASVLRESARMLNRAAFAQRRAGPAASAPTFGRRLPEDGNPAGMARDLARSPDDREPEPPRAA